LTKGIFFVLSSLPYGFTKVKRYKTFKKRDFMPQIKSAKKRLKQSLVAEKRNSAYKSRMRTSRRSFNEALEAGELEKVKETYAAYCSALDKAVKNKIIKRNTSTRSKRRGAEKVRALENAG
jgi:small subunit ribosomal protein S20